MKSDDFVIQGGLTLLLTPPKVRVTNNAEVVVMARTGAERVRQHRQRQLDRIAELEAQVAAQCPHPDVAGLEAQVQVLTAQLTRDGQRPTRSQIVKELGEALAQAHREYADLETTTQAKMHRPQRAVGGGGTGCQRSPQRRGGNSRRQSGRGRSQTRRPVARGPGHPGLVRHRAAGAVRAVGESAWRNVATNGPSMTRSGTSASMPHPLRRHPAANRT